MKIRHIGGIENRVQALSDEINSLAHEISDEQENILINVKQRMNFVIDMGKFETNKLQIMLEKLQNFIGTDAEKSLYKNHFETQQKYSEFVIQIMQDFEKQTDIYSQFAHSRIEKLQLLKHKKEILDDGVRTYLSSGKNFREKNLNILYDMIDHIYELEFYDHAMLLK